MGMAEVGDSINGNWITDNVELIKETFEDLKSSFAPDPILTHHDDDQHQDHRLVSQLTWIGGCHRRMIEGVFTEHEFVVFAPQFDNPAPG